MWAGGCPVRHRRLSSILASPCQVLVTPTPHSRTTKMSLAIAKFLLGDRLPPFLDSWEPMISEDKLGLGKENAFDLDAWGRIYFKEKQSSRRKITGETSQRVESESQWEKGQNLTKGGGTAKWLMKEGNGQKGEQRAETGEKKAREESRDDRPRRKDASQEGIDFEAGRSWVLMAGYWQEGSGPIHLLSGRKDSEPNTC